MLSNVRIFVIVLTISLCTSLLLLAGELGSDSYINNTGAVRDDLVAEKRTEHGLAGSPYESIAYRSGDTFLLPQENKKLTALVDDFLVNDDTTGGCNQTSPAIAKDPTGNSVIVWVDLRATHPDIFARRYDSSGVPLDSSFRVNEVFSEGASSNSDDPSVAMDDAGNFIIVWVSYLDSPDDRYIFAQRYNSTGMPLDSNFKVNDELSGHYWPDPEIAMKGSGEFIIVWTDERNQSVNVYAQRYDSSAIPLDSNFRVSDDTIGASLLSHSSVAIDSYGNFAVTWDAIHDGHTNIYAQRYDTAGNALGSNFKVNDDTVYPYQDPDIAMDSDGNFTITWYDFRNDEWDIYAQRYDSSGTPLDSNFKVNDDTGTVAQFHSAISMDGSGNLIITWEDRRDDNFDIYAQRYDPSGTPVGANFKVNDNTGGDSTTELRRPAVDIDSYGNFTITWRDRRNDEWDIYAQRYDSSGTPLDSNFKVSNDAGMSYQRNPAMAVDESGTLVIAWEDERNHNVDIYAQRYDSSGSPIGVNFRVNTDTGTADQEYPGVAMNGSGGFIITWTDMRRGWNQPEIYVQRYDSLGMVVDSSLKVSDTETGRSSVIAMDNAGNFAVAWFCDEVYVRKFDASGVPLDSGVRVNEDVNWWQGIPSIGMDDAGNFIVVWQDDRNHGVYEEDIYAQRYDALANPIGGNFRVNDKFDDKSEWSPTVAMHRSGHFIIAWWGSYKIYAQRYDSSGAPLDTNFRVSEDYPVAVPRSGYPPAIAMDDSGYFTISWVDIRDGAVYPWGIDHPDIYAQTYYPSGEPIGSIYLVPNPDYVGFSQSSPAGAAYGGNIYFAWEDNRRAKGWDIYAKVFDLLSVEVKDDLVNTMPNKFNLSPNYPNPFNPQTTIEFSLKSSGSIHNQSIRTVISIYNILGQKVRTLIDEDRLPGTHRVIWDGKNDNGKEVASGIYFYQLRTKDYTFTKKMVLLK